MKLGWVITSVVHGAVALGAVVSFGSVKPLELDNVAPIEVEIISVAPIEQVGTKKEKDLTTKLAAKQPLKKIVEKDVPKPTPKPKITPKKDKPKPVIKPTPKATTPKLSPTIEKIIKEAAAEAEAKASPEQKFIQVASAPKPMKRPALPKKPKTKTKDKPNPLDDSKISALLDKLIADPEIDLELDFGDTEAGSLDGEFFDEDDEDLEVASLSQFEFNAVKNRMTQCWSIPAGAQDAGSVVVKVGFKLNQFAEVIGAPQVLNSSSHPSFQVMAEAAVRAIIQCAPYDMLPPEKYEVWNEFSMEFDPRSMFNG